MRTWKFLLFLSLLLMLLPRGACVGADTPAGVGLASIGFFGTSFALCLPSPGNRRKVAYAVGMFWLAVAISFSA